MLRYNQILSGICVLMCGIPKALGFNFCSEKVCRDVSWYMWPFSIFFITGVLLRFVPIGLVWNVTWCRWMQIVHLHRTFTFVNCTTAVSKLLPLEYGISALNVQVLMLSTGLLISMTQYDQSPEVTMASSPGSGVAPLKLW